MATIGRPRALDDYKRREVCALVAVGCGIEGAARYVGCNAVTIRREALRNPEFHEQLRNAELTCELEPLRAMKRAAATHWRAAAWLLERTQPDRFARREADSLTPAEIDGMIACIAEEILAELPDEDTIVRVGRRLSDWSNRLRREDRAAKRVRRDPHRRPPPPFPRQTMLSADEQPKPTPPT